MTPARTHFRPRFTGSLAQLLAALRAATPAPPAAADTPAAPERPGRVARLLPSQYAANEARLPYLPPIQ